MSRLFRFDDVARRHPAVEAWFADHDGELGALIVAAYADMQARVAAAETGRGRSVVTAEAAAAPDR